MLKDKKVIIMLIFISILIISIIFYLSSNKKYNYTKILDNKNYDIVYDKINSDKDKVPYININNSLIFNINQEIDSLYQNYLIFSPDGFNYDYSVSGDILSIIIKSYVVQPESTHYDIIYKSYNIDLKEMKLLTNKEILDRYNISEDKMKYYLYNKYLNYYNDLIEKKFFEEKQCDFSCFLENKNIDYFLEDDNFYINNNHLELYKYFNIFTEFNEEKYFNEDSFHFIIT